VFKPFIISLAHQLKHHLVLDFETKEWSKHDDFFISVVEALTLWITSATQYNNTSWEQLISAISCNKPVLNILHLYHWGLFYWKLRQSIRIGNVTFVNFAWNFSTVLFLAAHKKFYSRLTLLATHFLENSSVPVKTVLNSRLVNLTGHSTHFIPPDLLQEKVR